MASNDTLLIIILGAAVVAPHFSSRSGMRLVEAADWSYWGKHGPKEWPGLCNTGKRQSPINIVSDDAIRRDLNSLLFIRYDFAFIGTVTNTGHTVELALDGLPIHLNGGGLESTYVLEQMHFHWPAEHTVDGVRHPLELHFVHYDEQYGNASEASRHQNGIAVVAALFELSASDNLDLDPILQDAKIVSAWVGKSSSYIHTKIVPYLLLPRDHTTYYRYDGSLTTPPCLQSVVWFVLTERQTVSEAQLDIFRSIGTSNGTLKYNNRPIQNLHVRTVYHHLAGYSPSSSALVFQFFFPLYILLNIFVTIRL